MSSVVKTVTAFTDYECLMKALECVGTKVKRGPHGEIITDRVDYLGPEKFILENGRYVLVHDSYADNMGGYINGSNLKKWTTIAEWLTQVGKEYRRLRKEKMDCLTEEERIRAEERMRQLVEQRCDEIKKKALEEGYDVKVTVVDGKKRLILTRITY